MSIFRRRSVSVQRARQLIARGHTLLDVRSEKEWDAGHVEGARHIPVGDLESRLGDLPIETPVVALCHSGIRSLFAARTLAKHGYSVVSVRGGMIAWNHTR